MSYTHNWANADSNGHLLPGENIHAIDLEELKAIIDRRLKVMFDTGDNWPIDLGVAAGESIASGPIGTARNAFAALLPAGSYFVHSAGWDQLSMWAQWLYPVACADENKIIVADSKPPAAGEVGFFAKLNGQANWTGQLSAAPAAVHVNELRDAAALLCRGRYTFRVGDGGAAHASKDLPEGLWYPPAVARDGDDELHSWFGGRQWLWPGGGQAGFLGPRGQSVNVRSATLRLRPEGDDVKVKLYHCKRNVNTNNFSWQQYDADAGLGWASPGGAGGGDADLLANMELTDGNWAENSLTTLVQQMFDGQAEPTFMLVPDEDTGWPYEPTHVAAELIVDFDWSGG